MLAVALAGCGRTEVYPRPPRPVVPVPPPPDPCGMVLHERPCVTACGPGIERCVDGLWGGCTAPMPLDPPETIDVEGTLRDFRQTHPDFENLIGDDRGVLQPTLGADQTPVFALGGPSKTINGPQTFEQWFHDTPGTNQSQPHILTLKRVATAPLLYSFSDANFFPLDGQLLGNEGNAHNFHFTLELHTEVEYRGGEALFFEGDDDLWVFVNGQLVIDLGGPHPTQAAVIGLDNLGLTLGRVYPLDVFFAERHRTSSTLRIETTNARFIACPP